MPHDSYLALLLALGLLALKFYLSGQDMFLEFQLSSFQIRYMSEISLLLKCLYFDICVVDLL